MIKTIDDFLSKMSLECEMQDAMNAVSKMMSRYQKENLFDCVKESPTSAVSKIYYLFREYDKNADYYHDSEIDTLHYLEKIFKLVAKGYEELEEMINE